jgi:hypothetical protein
VLASKGKVGVGRVMRDEVSSRCTEHEVVGLVVEAKVIVK